MNRARWNVQYTWQDTMHKITLSLYSCTTNNRKLCLHDQFALVYTILKNYFIFELLFTAFYILQRCKIHILWKTTIYDFTLHNMHIFPFEIILPMVFLLVMGLMYIKPASGLTSVHNKVSLLRDSSGLRDRRKLETSGKDTFSWN